jgi:hypothetical protein
MGRGYARGQKKNKKKMEDSSFGKKELMPIFLCLMVLVAAGE